MPIQDLSVLHEALRKLEFNAGFGPGGDVDAAARATTLREAFHQLLNAEPAPSEADMVRFGVSISSEAEDCEGSFATRAEAIDAGAVLHEGRPFYVHKGQVPDPALYLGDIVENVCSTVWDNMQDDTGIDAEGYPNPSPLAKLELHQLVSSWLRRHCWPDFWQETEEPEEISTVVTADE